MLINEKIIYFQLHKTGCTHTRKVLENIPGFEHRIVGKHNTYDTVPDRILGDFDKKVKVGNIRNPWDWYVSLFAFGCLKKGGLYERVTYHPDSFSVGEITTFFRKWKKNDPVFTGQKKRTEWANLYKDGGDADNFRAWLKLILRDKRSNIGEHYKESPISASVGLLTFRYLRLYTYRGRRSVLNLKNFKSAMNHDLQSNFIDVMIRNEHIHEDLLGNAKRMGCHEDVMRKILERFTKKTNESIRSDYQDYYDDETIELVRSKEKLIVEKYSYSF